VAEPRIQVELTASFIEQLESIEAFLTDAGAPQAYDKLLDGLRRTVIPNLRRFPRIGRRYLDNPPQSAEALAQLLHGDYLMLYTQTGSTVYLLSIRHHHQLSFAFAKLWEP
jgi:plasmid stabilization system protein ParE